MSGFNMIKTHELPAWMASHEECGVSDVSEILDSLTLIDDLLTLQRSQSLLTRKNKKLKHLFDARLELELKRGVVL